MDARELFKLCLREADAVIERVDPSHFNHPTPCDDWNLKQLLQHLYYELAWAPDIFAGKTIKQVGDSYEGDLLGKDYQASWQKLSNIAQKAIDVVKPKAKAHLSYGTVPMERYVKEIANDLLVHSWDIGQAMDYTLILDHEAVETIYKEVLPRADSFAESGFYGPRVKLGGIADTQIKLLAIYGRPSRKWDDYTRHQKRR